MVPSIPMFSPPKLGIAPIELAPPLGLEPLSILSISSFKSLPCQALGIRVLLFIILAIIFLFQNAFYIFHKNVDVFFTDILLVVGKVGKESCGFYLRF